MLALTLPQGYSDKACCYNLLIKYSGTQNIGTKNMKSGYDHNITQMVLGEWHTNVILAANRVISAAETVLAILASHPGHIMCHTGNKLSPRVTIFDIPVQRTYYQVLNDLNGAKRSSGTRDIQF